MPKQCQNTTETNQSPDKPKVKASAIICPIPECNYRCVKHQEPLTELFLRHLKKVHHITPNRIRRESERKNQISPK